MYACVLPLAATDAQYQCSYIYMHSIHKHVYIYVVHYYPMILTWPQLFLWPTYYHPCVGTTLAKQWICKLSRLFDRICIYSYQTYHQASPLEPQTGEATAKPCTNIVRRICWWSWGRGSDLVLPSFQLWGAEVIPTKWTLPLKAIGIMRMGLYH